MVRAALSPDKDVLRTARLLPQILPIIPVPGRHNSSIHHNRRLPPHRGRPDDAAADLSPTLRRRALVSTRATMAQIDGRRRRRRTKPAGSHGLDEDIHMNLRVWKDNRRHRPSCRPPLEWSTSCWPRCHARASPISEMRLDVPHIWFIWQQETRRGL
jgi:hypothetical protein